VRIELVTRATSNFQQRFVNTAAAIVGVSHQDSAAIRSYCHDMSLDEVKRNDVEQVEETMSTSLSDQRSQEEKALVRKIDLCLLPTIW
jgi:hypothetical protein